MELRRALLLFALVLGVAAIASSVTRPRETKRDEPPAVTGGQAPAPAISGRPRGPAAARIVFEAGEAPATERLAAGRPATVTVEVRKSGLVELGGLGLNAPADPLTPARFEVLADREGRHPVRFTPSGSRESKTVGNLEVGPVVAGR